MTLVVARAVDIDQFGVFGIAMLLSFLGLGVGRALLAEPFLVRFSESRPTRRSVIAGSQMAGAALVGGLGLTTLIGIATLFAPSGLAFPLLALAVTFPLLLWQDTLRFIAFGRHLPAKAVMNDSIQLAIQTGFTAAIALSGKIGVSTIILAWGGAAGVAAIASSCTLHTPPYITSGFLWYREQWSLGSHFLFDFVLSKAASQFVFMGLAVSSGLYAVAALRGAMTLTGPMTIIVPGLGGFALPTATGFVKQRNAPRLLRLTRWCSAGLIAANFAWWLILLFIPDTVGVALLGDSWTAARSAVAGILIYNLASSPLISSMWSLRALEATREVLKARLIFAPIVVIAGSLGGAKSGALGAGIGMGFGAAAGAVAAWTGLRRSSATLDCQ